MFTPRDDPRTATTDDRVVSTQRDYDLVGLDRLPLDEQ